MKKFFKRVSAVVTALAIMVTAVVFDVPEKITAETAVSESVPGGCDGTHTGMTACTNSASLPTSGSYYLDVDVYNTVTSNARSAAADVSGKSLTLCLNGHKIDAQQKLRIFYIGSNGSLTLCDCQGTGKLTGGGNVTTGGAVTVQSSGSFIMYGGTISGNNVAYNAGGVFVSSGTTFTMYGGTISGNTADVDGNGGGVFASYGTFTIDGNGSCEKGA